MNVIRRIGRATLATITGVLMMAVLLPGTAQAHDYTTVAYTGVSRYYTAPTYCGSANFGMTCGQTFQRQVSFTVSYTFGFSYSFFSAQTGWSSSQSSSYYTSYNVNTNPGQCATLRVRSDRDYKQLNVYWDGGNRQHYYQGQSRVYKGATTQHPWIQTRACN